jgi:hypothetical protein
LQHFPAIRIKHKRLQIHPKGEWCLLGCYTVWLL